MEAVVGCDEGYAHLHPKNFQGFGMHVGGERGDVAPKSCYFEWDPTRN